MEIVLEVKAPVSDVPACPICLDFCHVGNEVETFTSLHHLLAICSPLSPPGHSVITITNVNTIVTTKTKTKS